jgi:hypothetical protein
METCLSPVQLAAIRETAFRCYQVSPFLSALAKEVVSPWLVAWFAWFPVVIGEPSLIALWLAIGWWFLPEDWWR